MRYLFALMAGLGLAAGVNADPVTFDYTLTGPVSLTPPTVFSTATQTPSLPAFPAPVLTASTPTATGSVTQSGFGLGVRSGTFSIIPPVFTFQEVAGGPNAFRVDNVGILGGGREELRLTVSGIPGSYSETHLTAATFGGVLDLGAAPDVEILKNGVSQGTFNYNGLFGGTLTLPTPIPLMNGDVLTFRPVTASQFNGFALAGVQISANVPEPLSLAVFGGLAAVGGLAARRRMRKA